MRHLILYAEDDELMAEMCIKKFKEGGYDVTWAEDGQQAIELYREYTPDIIILDIKMPKLDGYQVAKEIRRKDLRTPILFLTSYTGVDSAVKALNLAADDYIRKGISGDELLAKIRRQIERNPVMRERKLVITPDTWLDTVENVLYSSGHFEKIGFRECNLLYLLVVNKNTLQKREFLQSQIWGDKSDKKNRGGKTTAEDCLYKAISTLRKIMADDKRIMLLTKAGEGIALTIDS